MHSSRDDRLPRAALIFSGLLRNACGPGGSPQALMEQAEMCRTAFGSDRCHIFLHTWATAQKVSSYWPNADSHHPKGHHHNHDASNTSEARAPGRALSLTRPMARPPSSWPCVGELRKLMPLTAVSVEDQPPPPPSDDGDHLLSRELSWGPAKENLLNMRMQLASMRGGLDLARRHASSVERHVRYTAVVRMRADIGDNRVGGGRLMQAELFPSRASWQAIRRRADLYVSGKLDQRRANELVTCRHPRTKLTDFCQWSVPMGPLVRVVDALSGDEFARTVFGDGRHESCLSFLNRTIPPWLDLDTREETMNDEAGARRGGHGRGPTTSPGALPSSPRGMPPLPENLIFCAMRTAKPKVFPSSFADAGPRIERASTL
jgi:hypothetical protein